MADLVGCVKEIGKWILTQFVHFVYYWWCFHDNIKDLVSGIEELKLQKHDIEQKCEEARLLTNILRPRVEEWLEASAKKLEEAQNILVPNHNIPKAWNITSRYSMGKRAKETAEEIAKLLNDGNFNPIAYPAPPAAMGSPLHRPTVDFESRKSIEKNIIDSLKNSNVDMIGICGMGGVGKTIMAQRIGKRAKEENLYDEVVMVTVSQTMDMPKIQNEIAELLGLKFDVESIGARADKLRKRLEDAKRKIIILDDVWKSPSFENLGIPIDCNFERCKVVLTIRNTGSNMAVHEMPGSNMAVHEMPDTRDDASINECLDMAVHGMMHARSVHGIMHRSDDGRTGHLDTTMHGKISDSKD